jgi:hypothetical protein
VGGDAIIQCYLFWLIFLPAGAVLSLDALKRVNAGKASQTVRGWMMLLLQVQLALIYFSSFLFKLYDPVWVGGTALAHAWQLPFYPRPWVAPLFEFPWLLAAGTWGAWFFELAFPVLIWFRRFRPWLLVCGTIFHLILEFTMRLGRHVGSLRSLSACKQLAGMDKAH